MKELFTIGETSKINNIPIKTLRYYDEIGILKPTYVDEYNGYRYYNHHQFYLLDIIKYGKNLGLSLEDIKKITISHNPSDMLSLLKAQQEKAEEKIQELSTILNSITNSIHSLEKVELFSQQNLPYNSYVDERYIIAVYTETEITFDKLDLLLKDIIKDKKFEKYLSYKYGLLLDFKSLKNSKIKIIGEFMELTEKPPFNDSRIIRLPKGEYFCFQDKLLSKSCNPNKISSALSLDTADYNFIIADEMYYYPDWSKLLYEIKIQKNETDE